MKRSYLRRPRSLQGVRLTSHAQAPDGSLSPAQILRAYGFEQGQFAGVPSVAMGVLSLGGGVVQADIALACEAWGMPTPNLAVTSVGGAVDDPYSDPGANEENSLDILVLAFTWWYLTGTPATIRFCVGPNVTGGMTQALAALGSIGCSVVSCSWGGPDESWSPAEREGFSAKLAALTEAGLSFFAASGDGSEDDGEAAPAVDYPCGDPAAWAVGGTSLYLTADGAISRETAWGDGLPGDEGGGGGFDFFTPMPAWQHGIVPGAHRGAPDSAACADPETGWQVFANGAPAVIGGTSAAAPLLAALTAVAKAKGGVPGLLAPRLYASRSAAFADVLLGSNGAPAAAGWDPATGLGSPKGVAFLTAVGNTEPAPGGEPPPPATMRRPPSPGSAATLANALAWVHVALASGPAVLVRSQAEALVAAALEHNWPKGEAAEDRRPPPAPAPPPAPPAPAAPPEPPQPPRGPDLVLVGYVGRGIAVRGLGGQGVEVTTLLGVDPGPGEGARFVGWNRPAETITEQVRDRPGPLQVLGRPSK